MTITYETLSNIIKQYLSPNDCEIIHKAYLYAQTAHENQRRKSGEPYIIHPLAVACILAHQKMPIDVIIAGLLHDVIEDTDISLEEIRMNFNEDVANIVDGVTKIKDLSQLDSANKYSENQKKLLVASAKDVRVIIVKLADRLHNMQTIQFMNENKQKEIAKETIEVYAPIAHRLGMYRIKWELEDLSFKILNRHAYDEIAEKINMKRSERDEYVIKMIEKLEQIFKENDLNVKIVGRTKHIYSIYRTMKYKNKTFDEIHDLFGFRILVNTVNECYRVLGVLHSNFKPIPLCFKDYIPTPKHNFYQSIHTTVLTQDGFKVEFQIRTFDMEDVAENGIAAHWKYKEGISNEEVKNLTDMRLANFKSIINNLTNKNSDYFMKSLKDDFFSETIITYTPKGDVIELPKGSCALDFAFYIHSKIGYSALNAKVNETTVSLFYPLKMGDVVNIITNELAEPQFSYIQKVKTHRAKEALKKYFNNLKRKEIILETTKNLVELGKEIECKKLIEKDEEFLLKLAINFNVYDVEEFIYDIGIGNIPINEIKKIILDKKNDIIYKHLNDIIIDQKIDSDYVLCRKCKPLYSDDIIATNISKNKYLVHRNNCRNIIGDKIEAHWNNINNEKEYNIKVYLEILDRPNILIDILNLLSKHNIDIKNIYLNSDYDDHASGSISFLIKDIEQFKLIQEKILTNKNILKFDREKDEDN